jgi:hypothetical protein
VAAWVTIDVDRRFGGTYSLRLQGRKESSQREAGRKQLGTRGVLLNMSSIYIVPVNYRIK